MKLNFVQFVLPFLAALPILTLGAPKFGVKNHFLSGVCNPDDVIIYTDDTRIENSGPSTLNATLEIYIDPPVPIKCIIAEDQMEDGTGGIMTLNSGGMNHNWVFLDVQGQYGQGFHFKITIFGFPPSPKLATFST
uniref:Secreted protein n=1 Tax=Lutzomyia longipalpis TaxID=7200 RepID=A0A1B0GJZ7_LUTLO